MKLETLEDLLTIDHTKLKADDNKRLINKVKALIKVEGKSGEISDNKAESLPYEALSVVGNKLVYLRFDLASKEARVVDTETDSRDTKRNYMVGAKAVTLLKGLVRTQQGEE